jgi:hypothetical protein
MLGTQPLSPSPVPRAQHMTLKWAQPNPKTNCQPTKKMRKMGWDKSGNQKQPITWKLSIDYSLGGLRVVFEWNNIKTPCHVFMIPKQNWCVTTLLHVWSFYVSSSISLENCDHVKGTKWVGRFRCVLMVILHHQK